MKLLFDENLSPKLVERLTGVFPGSAHVVVRGLQGRPDVEVWTFARDYGFALVSKDADFEHLALVRGAPPKVVILRAGNTTTAAIADRLLESAPQLRAFDADEDAALLVLPTRRP